MQAPRHKSAKSLMRYRFGNLKRLPGIIDPKVFKTIYSVFVNSAPVNYFLLKSSCFYSKSRIIKYLVYKKCSPNRSLGQESIYKFKFSGVKKRNFLNVKFIIAIYKN